MDSFYPNAPNLAQRDAYMDRLRRFDEHHLEKLAAAVVDNCKWFPKIVEILDVAMKENIWPKRAATKDGNHTWEKTECPLCGGEGRLVGIYNRESQPVNVFPYSTPRGDIPYVHGDYQYIFRCRCGAEKVPTIPKWIPQWTV